MKMTTENDAVFKALSDPTRRGLFAHLCREGDTTVAGLHAISTVSQPVVSKHLKVLKNAGLVSGRPSGRNTIYAARPQALAPLIDWTREMASFWEARFDDLEELLRRMDQ